MSLCCRSLVEIEELLLLPDMDPRLAALLPALRRSGSCVSSTGIGTGPATVVGVDEEAAGCSSATSGVDAGSNGTAVRP